MTINDSDLFKRGTNASSNTTEDEWHQFIDTVRAKWFGMQLSYYHYYHQLMLAL